MAHHDSPAVVAELMAKVKARQELHSRQKREVEDSENRSTSPTNTDPYSNTPPTGQNSDEEQADNEVYRLKRELDLANERMAQMNLQLTQSRLAQHTMEEAIGSPFPTAQHLAANIPGHSMLPSVNGLSQATDFSRATTPFENGNISLQHQS